MRRKFNPSAVASSDGSHIMISHDRRAGTTGRKERTVYARCGYIKLAVTPMQAAKSKAERTRPGVSFFWQVFERELNIDTQCIHIAVANVEDILYPKSRVQQALEDWEDYMKSRKGLQMLIATYPPNISVECAVGASWLNWVDPY